MKPILMNTEMVRAILDGRKTVTRRLIKPQPSANHVHPLGYLLEGKQRGYFGFGTSPFGEHIHRVKPPYNIGDILYVRETGAYGIVDCEDSDGYIGSSYISQCEGENDWIPKEWAERYRVGGDEVVWTPSIHMPKEAARIFLRVTGVRVERLKDITCEQAYKEGFEDEYKLGDNYSLEPKKRFIDTWNSIYSENPWESNPWVWVIEFEVITKEELINE